MAIVLVTIVITGAIWFSQSLKLLEMVVQGGAPLFLFFQMMFLVLPSFLAPIMPIALFLGLLFTMQKLLQDHEWIVMQGIGMSPWQLARPALLITFTLMIVHSVISIELAPGAQRELRFQRKLVQTDYAGALLREGTFNAIGKDITIYVYERSSSNFYKGILIHDTRNPLKAVTLTAEEGFLVGDNGPPRLVIQHGTRQERNLADGKINWLIFDQYVVDLAMLNDTKDNSFIKSYERPMSELLSPSAETIAANPHAQREFLAEAHQRISFPLYNLAFAFIALVVVLGGEFSRRGRPVRYVTGLILAVALQAGALALANISAKNNMMIPLLYLPPCVVILLGTSWIAILMGRRNLAA